MITINYNEEQEMMEIKKDNETIFFGNWWDFHNSPTWLAEFLISLDVKVRIKKVDFE